MGRFLSTKIGPRICKKLLRPFITGLQTLSFLADRHHSANVLPPLKRYRVAFEGYFGFLVHIEGYQNVTFDQLFDLTP